METNAICPECGAAFVKKRNAVYCSRQCRYEVTRRSRPPRRCDQCGEQFHPHWSGQHYCSRICGSRATAPLRAKALRGLEERECQQCGKTLKPRSEQTKFCSRQCYYDSTGGRYAAGNGYWRIKVPKGTPGADRNGRMLEHRYVMQESLGRALTAREVVHHVNGDRGDNRLENLQLVKAHHGKGQRFRCRSCGSHDVEAIDL